MCHSVIDIMWEYVIFKNIVICLAALSDRLSCRTYEIPLHLVKCLNPSRAETELSRFNWVNITAADALAPRVSRTSAAMMLTT